MIIENRWFALQGPRRADLSGRPFGFLFIWKPRDFPRFGPLPRKREFGFFIPSIRFRWHEPLECAQFVDQPGTIPHDWRLWPEAYKKCADAAVQKAVDERPGTKIASDKSYCDRRIDLSGRPLQLYRSIKLKKVV